VINLTASRTREQAELKLGRNPECIYGLYNFSDNAIILDAWKLRTHVNEKVNGARSVGVDLGDPETVWIIKFASVVSHEVIHKVLNELENEETSKRFDYLYLAYFMGKIPPHSIHVSLWSDVFETCPIGDTCFS
jgi:hypothetical protein